MKYKKVLLPPEPYYSGRVTRYPDRKVAFESGLRWHGSYEISYIKKGKVKPAHQVFAEIRKERGL